MKRITQLLCLLLIGGATMAQGPVRETSPESFTNKIQRIIAGRNLTLPLNPSKPTLRPSLLNGGVDSVGSLMYNKNDSLVYKYVGGDLWLPVSGSPYVFERALDVYSVKGTGQLQLPAGNTAARKSAQTGDFRYNSDSLSTEVYNGSWNAVSTHEWVRANFPENGTLATVAYTGSYNDLRDVPAPEVFLTPDGGLTGLNSFSVGIKVDSSKYSTVYETRRLIDSIAVANGGGISAVTPGYGLSGAGTAAVPLKADTISPNGLVTKSYLQEAFSSFDGGSGGSSYSLINSPTTTISGDGVTTPWQVNVTGSAGSNPQQALSIYDFGGKSDANVGTLDVTGTDNTAALNAMIAAAADNQPIIIPAGEWLFNGVIDTIKGPKRLNLICYGNTYHRGHDWIIITNTGPFETHTVRHYGRAYGQVATAMPAHTKSHFDAGDGPNWSSFTGVLVKIYNAYEQHIELNYSTGFDAPIEIIGETKPGQAASGSQENDIWLGWSYKNANGIKLTSLNGQSYCDKNNFWFRRISGGMGIRMDGYSGVSWADGQTWNGAFRSNHFHGLIEQVDSIMFAYGDITEPEFDITIEGGVNTGVFEPGCAINIGMTGPNVMRSPRWDGQGVMSHRHMVNGMGYNGLFMMPVWQDNNYIGNFAVIDEEGYIIFEVSSDFFINYRNVAPANFKFVTFGDREDAVNITSTAYTVARGVKYVYYNASGGTITLPSTVTSVARDIYIINTHATAAVTVANVKTGYVTSVPAGAVMWYRSEGAGWYSLMPLPGTGGGGGTGESTNWDDLTGGNVGIAGKVRIGSATLQPTAKLHISAPSGAANDGGLKLDAGPLVAVAEKGLFQHGTDGSLYFTGNDGITRKFAFDYARTYQTHVVTTSTAYTPTADIGVVICNYGGSGACSITMPDATKNAGREIFIQNIGTNSSGVTVNNADPNMPNTLPNDKSGMVLFCDGTEWRVVTIWKRLVSL